MFSVDVYPPASTPRASAHPTLTTVGGTVQGSTAGTSTPRVPARTSRCRSTQAAVPRSSRSAAAPGTSRSRCPSTGWVAGTRTVTINGAYSSGGGAATWTIAVTSPCTFGVVTSPSPVSGQVPLTMYGNGTLAGTSISFTTTGTCSTATLRLSAAGRQRCHDHQWPIRQQLDGEPAVVGVDGRVGPGRHGGQLPRARSYRSRRLAR